MQEGGSGPAQASEALEPGVTRVAHPMHTNSSAEVLACT